MLQKKILLLIIGTVIFYAAFMIYSDVNELMKNFATVNLMYLPLIFLLNIAAVFFRGLRQKVFYDSMLLKMPTKDNLKIQFAGLSMIFTPGGAGEALKLYYINNKYKFPYGKTFGVFLFEKYHDLLGPIIVLTIFLIYSHMVDIKIIVGLLWIPLILIYLIAKNGKISDYVLKKIPDKSIFKKIKNNIDEIKGSLFILSSNKVVVKGMILTIISVIMQAAAFYIVFLSFDFDINFIDSTVISYTSAIIGTLSLLPGGIGLTETSMVGFLVKYGFAISASSAVVIFLRLTGIWFFAVTGFVATKFLFQKKLSN